jgi:hypothetical protein
MKKILLLTVCTFFVTVLFAQQDSAVAVKKKKAPINLGNRANDHFLLQLGLANWAGKPDTITTSGFSKSFNVYFMFDFPFKTNPKLSMAFGPGIASDHINFKNYHVGIKDQTDVFQFLNQADTNHFKKTKLATIWLEAPVEFRFSSDPVNNGKSFKWAIGLKVGTLIKAYTRYKDLETKDGTSINSYTGKDYSKRFINSNRLSAMARVGIGHFSLFGSYQITTLLKDGRGAAMRPYSMGITLSGL